MSAHHGHPSLHCQALHQLSGAEQGSTEALGDKPVQHQHRSLAHTTASAQAAGTRKLSRRLVEQTALAKDSSPSSREALGSCSSTAEGWPARTRVRASCPCCSLPAGLHFLLGSQAEVVHVPTGLSGPSFTAAAMFLLEQQVVLRSAPLPVGSKKGPKSFWFWAVLWQGSRLATQGCQLAQEMPEQTGRSRQPHVSLGESFPAFSVLLPHVFVS